LSEPDAIGAWLTEGDVPINRVGLEIGGLSRWLYIELKARGWPAICIDPRRLRGLTKTMPVKTDRNDPRSIAQVMRIGWFSIVHVKSTGSQELRMLLANRKMLLTKQIDIENEIRGTLRVFGLKLSGRIQQSAFERQAMGADLRSTTASRHGPPDACRARGAARAVRCLAQDDVEGCSS
jgi:transposase